MAAPSSKAENKNAPDGPRRCITQPISGWRST
jgi:hypothetical protein